MESNTISMKKIFFVLISSLCILASANAQFNASDIFGGANIGYSKPVKDIKDYAKAGLTFNVEAGYKLRESLGVGFMYQHAITGGIDSDTLVVIDDITNYKLESFLVKGWYILAEEEVKPYISLAAGIAKVSEPDVTIGATTTEGTNRIGLAGNLEVGILLRGFNVSYSFNLAGKTPETAVLNGGGDISVFYHYFGIGYIYNL